MRLALSARVSTRDKDQNPGTPLHRVRHVASTIWTPRWWGNAWTRPAPTTSSTGWHSGGFSTMVVRRAAGRPMRLRYHPRSTRRGLQKHVEPRGRCTGGATSPQGTCPGLRLTPSRVDYR